MDWTAVFIAALTFLPLIAWYATRLASILREEERARRSFGGNEQS